MQKARSFLPRPLFGALLLILGSLPGIKAQQVTCTGSFGDPVINITFGSGSNPGPALKAATTSYQYVTTYCPSDGYYTVTNSTNGCFGNTWHNITADHSGKPNGYFMLINASYQPSDFYLDTVKGLCANTTYRFAAWIANVLPPSSCNSAGIQPNITFRVETTTGTVLQSYNSGNIPSSSAFTWKQYGLDFTTPAGVSDVVLRMTNNSVGGCGNDLALDDITFSPCGPKVQAGITGGNGSNDVQFCIDAQSAVACNGTVSPGYAAPDYQWQVSTDTGATWTDIPGQQTTTYTRNPTPAAGLYQYRLAVSEGGNIAQSTCRVASNVITVTVNPKPTPAAGNNGPVCEGATAMLNAVGGGQYDWTGPNGFTATATTPSISIPSVSPAAAGVYNVTVTSTAGCTQTDLTTLVVLAVPLTAFAPGNPACEKSLLPFIDQSAAASGQSLIKWRWDFGDGSSDTLQNPVHVYAGTGSYTVGLIVTTDKGCSNTAFTRSVTVHPLPLPDFSLPEICLADPLAVFNDSSRIADGTEAAFSYQWNFGDPNADAGHPNGSVQKNATHKYQAAGPYSVRLSVTSGDGCIKDTVKSFTINGDNPIAAFTVGNAALLCSNVPVMITDGSSVSPGRIIKTEIYWDYLQDPTVRTTDEDPAPGKEYSHSYPYFSSPATVTHQIRFVAYSGQTCLQEMPRSVTINAAPRTQFDGLPPVCEEVAPYLITAGRETEGIAGAGIYSGLGIDGDGLFTPRVATPGIDTLHYTFTGANGCFSRSDQTILVYPQPHADAGPAEYFLEGGEMTLEGSGSGNNISFSWSPADSILDNPHIARPRISPHDNIVYTLKVVSADGCMDSSKVQVIVLKIPIVPNAFSPNGDGINDTWVIRYLNEYPAADVQVFNRYGQPVYHVIGYTTPWDGTYHGQPLPVGTYYWIINPKNGRKQFSGSVTIIR